MGSSSARAQREIAAPIDDVWALVADARGYSTWAIMRSSELEVEGVPAPDGVGAVRRFGTGAVKSREEVVVFEPPLDGSAHLGYQLLSGLPVENYRADVELTSTGAGTLVVWHSAFDVPKRWLRGPVTGFMNFVLKDFTRRLAKALT